jgi:hypothetical protein
MIPKYQSIPPIDSIEIENSLRKAFIKKPATKIYKNHRTEKIYGYLSRGLYRRIIGVTWDNKTSSQSK